MRVLGAFVAVLVSVVTEATGQTIDYIAGTTEITGLSADGRSAAARQSGGAMYWSRESGLYRIWSDFPSGYSAAYGISGDGRVVSGDLQGPSSGAFLWCGPGQWQNVGHTPNTTNAVGTGLNWDGSVMSGTAYIRQDYAVAVRWTESTGMQVIGPLPGDAWSEAKGISRDGSTIVGTSAGQFSNGFVWTADGGIRRLQRLGDNEGSTGGYATNFDGSLIVGQTGLYQMSIWRDGQAELLGPGGEFSSVGYAVNDDGSVVVGSIGFGDQAAAVWTQGRGFELLSVFLTAHGVDLDPSWTLLKCTAVSADGQTFAGQALNSARQRIGFVATIPTPASCVVMIGAAMCTLRRCRQRNSV